MDQTPRVFADFNGYQAAAGSRPAQVPLDTWGTVRDLSDAGVALREGQSLVIYDQSDESEDLEADARAQFDAGAQRWVAVLQAGYRFVPHRSLKSSADRGFRCVGCRAEIESELNAAEAGEGQLRCPHCGTDVSRVVAPPLAF